MKSRIAGMRKDNAVILYTIIGLQAGCGLWHLLAGGAAGKAHFFVIIFQIASPQRRFKNSSSIPTFDVLRSIRILQSRSVFRFRWR